MAIRHLCVCVWVCLWLCAWGLGGEGSCGGEKMDYGAWGYRSVAISYFCVGGWVGLSVVGWVRGCEGGGMGVWGLIIL